MELFFLDTQLFQNVVPELFKELIYDLEHVPQTTEGTIFRQLQLEQETPKASRGRSRLGSQGLRMSSDLPTVGDYWVAVKELV